MVKLWHTPFGTLQDAPGVHYSDLDPVSVQHDGSLLIPDASSHHSGLYYCLLQDTVGITIQPYQILTDEDRKEDMNHDGHNNSDSFGINARNDSVQLIPVSQQAGHSFRPGDPSMDDPTKQEGRGYLRQASRVSRDVVGVGSNEVEGAALSASHLAGAVAASVVVTFLVGFSAGALSRVYVLRWVSFHRRLLNLRHYIKKTPKLSGLFQLSSEGLRCGTRANIEESKSVPSHLELFTVT